MKKLGIIKTLKKRRKCSEKRKLEGTELKFFLSTSDSRLNRVRSGARLFNVIRDQEELNEKPLKLIETVLDKQFE